MDVSNNGIIRGKVPDFNLNVARSFLLEHKEIHSTNPAARYFLQYVLPGSWWARVVKKQETSIGLRRVDELKHLLDPLVDAIRTFDEGGECLLLEIDRSGNVQCRKYLNVVREEIRYIESERAIVQAVFELLTWLAQKQIKRNNGWFS